MWGHRKSHERASAPPVIRVLAPADLAVRSGLASNDFPKRPGIGAGAAMRFGRAMSRSGAVAPVCSFDARASSDVGGCCALELPQSGGGRGTPRWLQVVMLGLYL